MAKRDTYTVPASKQGMTARQLVMQRLQNLQRMLNDGKRIQDTQMTYAFIRAVS